MTTHPLVEVECLTCGNVFETEDVAALAYQCDDCGRAESMAEQRAVDDNADYKEQQ